MPRDGERNPQVPGPPHRASAPAERDSKSRIAPDNPEKKSTKSPDHPPGHNPSTRCSWPACKKWGQNSKRSMNPSARCSWPSCKKRGQNSKRSTVNREYI
ncbi:hypothetical protein TIFTF001_041225, partial [Ficus carica]